MQLTFFGQEISDGLNAKAWAKNEAKKLGSQFDGEADWFVQDCCFNFVENEQIQDEWGDALKAQAYESGVDQQVVLQVLAIELRDAILATRKPHSRKHE